MPELRVRVPQSDEQQQTAHVRQTKPALLSSKVQEKVQNLLYGQEYGVLAERLPN